MRAVHHSNDLEFYEKPSAWADPATLALAQRIRFHADPNAQGDKHCGEMRVTLIGGRVLSISPQEIPDIHDVSTADLEAKFRRLAGSVLSEERSEAVLAQVNHLQDCTDVSRLAALLVSDKAHGEIESGGQHAQRG